MPPVTFDGVVVERTNHLKYLGIHFDTNTLKQPHWSVTKKGMSVLKDGYRGQ